MVNESLQNSLRIKSYLKNRSQIQSHLKSRSSNRNKVNSLLYLRMKNKKFLSKRFAQAKKNVEDERFIQIENDDDIDQLNKLNQHPQTFQLMNSDVMPKIDYKGVYVECQVKNGYIAQIIGHISQQNLEARTVFANINLNKIILQSNENQNSLIKQIPLMEVAKIIRPKSWQKVNCIQLVRTQYLPLAQPFLNSIKLNDQDKISWDIDTPLVQGSDMNICGKNQEDLNQWIKTIANFQQCVKEQDEKEKPQHFQKQPENLIIQKQLTMQESLKEQEFIENMHKNEQKQQDLVDEQIDELEQQMKQKQQKEQEIQKLQDQRLKEAQQKTDQLEQQKQLLQKISDERQKEELNGLILIEKEELNKKQKSKLETTRSDIISNIDIMDQQIINHNQELLDQENQKQKQITLEMINSTVNQEKLLDWNNCKLPSQESDEQQQLKAVKRVCSAIVPSDAIPDSKEIVECLTLNSFCDVCCNHFIGLVHRLELYTCHQDCNQFLVNDEQHLSSKGFIISSH